MQISQRSRWLILANSAILASSCTFGNADQTDQSAEAISGAGFSTFDMAQGGCADGMNGVNCNHYASKTDVYINGGPEKAKLADGSYYFAVLVPGTQHEGFVEGARGNLSDTVAGGTVGDSGKGDPIANRTFTVSKGVVTYSGTHHRGTSPQGHPVIQVAPFDDTSNEGGVYILAICSTGAKNPSDCKFDAFHVSPNGATPGSMPPGNGKPGDGGKPDTGPGTPNDDGGKGPGLMGKGNGPPSDKGMPPGRGNNKGQGQDGPRMIPDGTHPDGVYPDAGSTQGTGPTGTNPGSVPQMSTSGETDAGNNGVVIPG